VELVEQAAIKVDEAIIEKATKHFHNRILFIKTWKEAAEVYNLAKNIPTTTTREDLKSAKGIVIDGLLTSTRSELFYAFKKSIPFILKVHFNFNPLLLIVSFD
jgi:hypothetical protein